MQLGGPVGDPPQAGLGNMAITLEPPVTNDFRYWGAVSSDPCHSSTITITITSAD